MRVNLSFFAALKVAEVFVFHLHHPGAVLLLLQTQVWVQVTGTENKKTSRQNAINHSVNHTYLTTSQYRDTGYLHDAIVLSSLALV